MTKGDWQYLVVGVATIPAIGWVGITYGGAGNWSWGTIAFGIWFLGAFIRKPVGRFLHLLFTDPKAALLEVVGAALALGGIGLASVALAWGFTLLGEHAQEYFTEWDCVERGDTMLSISENGDLGPAEKACTCTGMADFERRKFGRVDYASLNKDHGCNFE